VRTKHLSLVTHKHSDTTSESEPALSPYGPVRVGLTTTQRTDTDHQLLELLNSLENAVENLNYKSFTVYDTLTIAIEAVRVALSATQADEGGTNLLQ